MTNLTPPNPSGTDPYGSVPAESDPASDPVGPGTVASERIDPAPGGAGRSPARGAVTAIAIAAAILGGGALVLTGGTSAIAAASQIATGSSSTVRTATADTAGVTGLRVEVGRGAATVRFDDVAEATMRTSGSGSDEWRLRRDGDVLRVDRPSTPFGWWFGGWFGPDPQMTLTLPRALEGELTADLRLDAGTLATEGRFDTLSTTVNAGSLAVDGGARTVTTRVSAGSAMLRLADVTTADLSMSAGDLNATISGRQPDAVRLDVSAGSMDVIVPTGQYALSKDSSAGSIDAQIQTDPSSTHRIQASLSAGSITLRQGN